VTDDVQQMTVPPDRARMSGQQQRSPAMTEPTTPPPGEDRADETFTWTQRPASHNPAGSAATNLLESVRDAVDELAERAAPSVRELSARAAELAAIAADRAAPLAKRAGEVTADASGRLATMSRSWAADLRASAPPAASPAVSAAETEADAASAEPMTGPGDGTPGPEGPANPS
jgi:hypothetical protein